MLDGTHVSCRTRNNAEPHYFAASTAPDPPPSFSRADAEAIATRERDTMRAHVANEIEAIATMIGEEVGELRRHERRHFEEKLAALRVEVLELRALVAELRVAHADAKQIDLPQWRSWTTTQ
jgi:hypothetical protein